MYFDAGWSPIPIPFREKSPVPLGFTGVDGVYVTETQMKAWCRPKARITVGNFNYPPGNIALRLPRNVLGIDVDAYGEKSGDATLTAAIADWGPLPPTWVSTSKSDGLSGIRFFRIPEGLSWPGELPQGKGVELLRWDHRFAIVYPSIHDKTGAEYGWHLQDDSLRLVASPEDFPSVGDLAELPQEWVEGLTGGTAWEARAVNAEMGEAEAAAWLASCVDPDGEACGAMGRTLTSFEREVRQAGDDGGAHDTARNGVWALLGDARSGHAGINTALTALRKVFLGNAKRESERVAKSEWKRFVFRGVAKVSNESPVATDDPCDFRIGLEPSTSAIFQFDEFGNAERLARVLAGRARWVPEQKSWYIWDTVRWAPNSDGQVDRWAVKAINSIDKEIASLGGTATEEDIAAFKKHQKASSTLKATNAMIGLVKNRAGISVAPSIFDANPALLNCPNGTLELSHETGVKFTRGQRAEDYLTKVTGADYKPEAHHQLWDNYLKTFQPDEEIRDWLQRLVGYSLFGSNAEQLLVVCQGVKGTGKTTFTEAIMKALGGYGGPLEASILRSNADDKPRPDVMKAMQRRIVIAEELSEFQHLHVDQVKRITGAGTLSARGMNSDKFVERSPAFTPWIMTNETPTIEGGDAALLNRVLVVPFTVSMPRTRNAGQMRVRILGEAIQAVLAWAVAGWELYLGGGDLREIPAGALSANMKFAEEMSDFHGFLAEFCDVGPEYHEDPTALFTSYQTWCQINSIRERDQMTQTKFGRRLGGMGFVRDRRTVNKKQVPRRIGLKLVDSARIETAR